MTVLRRMAVLQRIVAPRKIFRPRRVPWRRQQQPTAAALARSAATAAPPDAAEPEPEPTFEGGLMEALSAFAAQWEEAAAVLEGA